jgi:hypothetical protein
MSNVKNQLPYNHIVFDQSNNERSDLHGAKAVWMPGLS